jgi:opacity protein-like surface antigen
MKSLIKALAIAVVLGAPMVSFAQSNQPAAQNAQNAQAQVSQQQGAVQADTSGYGSSRDGSSQAGRGSDTAVSSYSPLIYNAR